MSNPNIGFVKLHTPGRGWYSGLLIVFIVIFVGTFFIVPEEYLAILIVGWIVALPSLLIVFEVKNRRQLLPRSVQTGGLAASLHSLSVRWIIWKKGKGCNPWNRVELELPRTIADISFKERMSKIEIPNGLIEPEKVRASKPGTILGCLLGSLFCGVFMFAGVSLAIGFRGSIIGWVIAAAFGLNIIQLVLGLPVIHRSRRLPAFLRHFGRRESLRRAFTVGPGWVKFGKRVWRADLDLLLIRRTGWRSASAEIDCLLAGPDGRCRMKFSGIDDDDFKILFGGWNIEDVRFEFVESELS